VKSNKKNISQESLENLVMALMQCRDEDGLLLNINPALAFQEWLVNMYPENLKKHWYGLHIYESPERIKND
jgi:hypothetical protein